MAFNFAAGIAKAGEGIADLAGKFTLEAQRADLAQQGVRLADELAGKRDETQRGFLDTQRVETQKFTGDQKGLDRTSAMDIQKLQSQTSLSVAGSAAASAKYASDAMKPVREAQIAASNAEAEGRKLDNELKTNQKTARRELEAATTGGNQAEIDAARLKVDIYDEGAALRTQQAKALRVETAGKELEQKDKKLISDTRNALVAAKDDPVKTAELKRNLHLLESSTADDRKDIAQWHTQAKIHESAMLATAARLSALEKEYGTSPTADALKEYLNKVMKQQERDFRAAAAQSQALLNALNPTAAVTGAPIDPNQFVTRKTGTSKAGTPAVTGAPEGTSILSRPAGTPMLPNQMLSP